MPDYCGKDRERHRKQSTLIILYAKPLREKQEKAYETINSYNSLCQSAVEKAGKGI